MRDEPLPSHDPPERGPVADLHARAERDASRHHRAMNAVRVFLGRPITIYAILAFNALWVTFNVVAPHYDVTPFDPPPFNALQGMLGLAALLIALVILGTQNRQAKLVADREDFELRVNLLAERKTAKIIELLEELRRDLPSVKNRRDTEAELLQKAADPDAALKKTDDEVGTEDK